MKGPALSDLPALQGISFQLAHAAKRVSEIAIISKRSMRPRSNSSPH
jgi:hypothetical protein